MSSSTVSKLDQLVGLGAAKRLVLQLAMRGESTHAVLFYGIPGSGKSEVGSALAQAWLCKSPGVDGADGECKACAAYLRGNNPDFLRVTPQGPSRIILNSQITPDSGNQDGPVPVVTFLRTMPLYSANKVVFIEDAQRMNASAANALLKTLEEPYAHAKLVLTTDSVGSILPTIRSRCLCVACELPNAEELRAVSPDVSIDVLRLVDGAPGRLAEAVKSPELFLRIARFGQSLHTRQPGDALAASDEFRGIAESLAEISDLNVRSSTAQALELLATWLAREPACPPAWAQQAIETHRLVQGNVNAGAALDALFAAILSRRS